ncbi:MAG: hypothetical protein WA947_05500 [Phormidesmis sp.]
MTNSPFHDPQDGPLSDANDIERESSRGLELTSFQDEDLTRSPSPHIKQDIQQLRNIVIGLLLTGLALGCVVGIGVVIVLKLTGLADPPNPRKGQTYEHLNVYVRTL